MSDMSEEYRTHSQEVKGDAEFKITLTGATIIFALGTFVGLTVGMGASDDGSQKIQSCKTALQSADQVIRLQRKNADNGIVSPMIREYKARIKNCS